MCRSSRVRRRACRRHRLRRRRRDAARESRSGSPPTHRGHRRGPPPPRGQALDVGGMNDGGDQKALRVGQDVALASVDLLAGVEAAVSAAFRGLHALAVDHPGRRRRLPPGGLARRHQQRVVDRRPQPDVPPQIEVMLHRRHRREHGRRQHPPRQAAAQQIQQRLDDVAIAPHRRPSAMRTRRQERLQHRPFRVRQVAWQAQPFTGKLPAGDIGPHLVTPWLLDTPMNHNRLISLNLFFGQALTLQLLF